MGAFITPQPFRRVTAPKVATITGTTAPGSAFSVNVFTVVGTVSLVSVSAILTSSITQSGGTMVCYPWFSALGTGDASQTALTNSGSVGLATSTPLNSMLGMGNTRSSQPVLNDASGRAAIDAPSNARIVRPGTIRMVFDVDGLNPGSLTGGAFTVHAIYEPHSPGAYMVPA